jgi:hypothetical protein
VSARRRAPNPIAMRTLWAILLTPRQADEQTSKEEAAAPGSAAASEDRTDDSGPTSRRV